MKSKIFFVAMLLTLICSAINAENGKADLHSFIGIWVGGYDHQDKVRKDSWTQTRKADGSFKLIHEIYQYGALSNTETSEGTWWVEGQYFYEKQKGSFDHPDKYLYELIGEKKIKFTEITTDDKTSEDIQGYSFIDTRAE